MSNRSAKFASAIVAGLMAGANFSAGAQTAATTAAAKPAETKTADNCLPGPKGTAPAGSHWRYHLDRTTKNKCWYLGEAKNGAAKTATAQRPQPAPEPEAEAADATPPQAQPQPQQPQPAMSKSVANARAEWPSPQAAAAPAAGPDQASAPGATAAPTDPNAASSAVSARWLDASSMAGSNGTRHAATAQPSMVVAQADSPQQQASTVAAAAPAAVEAPADKTSSSTQMLLIVMIGALALAGLVSALVVKLTRRRTSSDDLRDEQRAPWDSIYIEHTAPMQVNRARQLQLSDLPPRRAEPPIPRRETVRNAPEPTEADSRQIAAMLQRLARSTAN